MKHLRTIILTAIGLLAVSPGAALSAEWQKDVARVIASRQSYPRSAQIRGEQGTTRLRVVLSPNGKIETVQLTESSGSAILDREAQTVVSGIGKLPAPPSGISAIVIPIVWRLD